MMFISLKSTILDGRTDLYLSSSFPNSKEVLSHFGSSTYKILSSSNNLLERIDRLNMNDGNEELLNLRGVRRVFRARDPREIEEPLSSLSPLANDKDQLSPEEKVAVLKLSADLKALQFDGHFADVVFDFEDQTSVKAHKVILGTRSPVFAEMFFNKSNEKRDDKKIGKGEDGLTHVTIIDTFSDVFQNMLLFIYTGEISDWKLELIAADMLVVAEKYKLQELKSICEEALKKSLPNKSFPFGLRNALNESAEMYQLASNNDAADLKNESAKSITDFLKKNVDFIMQKDRMNEIFNLVNYIKQIDEK